MNSSIIRHQKGFSLTEALVAFVVTVGGLLAIASFQAGLFGNSAYNKARTEALTLAQQKIEEFKHYTHADEGNYIDANNDGVMDAVGTYSDDPINGQNAVFLRSWNISATDDGPRIEVGVAWSDAENEAQSVMLAASLPWISPRSGADQLSQLADPIVGSPTGRARLGEGNLADFPSEELTPLSSPGVDGLGTVQHDEDVFLVDSNNDILLTLEEACKADTGVCTEFVKISGTVYLDTANTKQDLTDIFVVASDAAHCERWVETGTLSNPPVTATRDYEYYHYTCYLAGGWHGNIGFLTSSGLSLRDKVCQGDPTSLNAWEEPVIAFRRVYRGMLHRDLYGQTRYYSHGVKDAARFTGQDYVFTELATDAVLGENCDGSNAPMTRPDSGSGMLFEGTPVDFVCLNADDDGNGQPDYLDDYDATVFNADTTCPFDPTDPPVQAHSISGEINILSAEMLDLTSFEVVTSDGPGNCAWVNPFTAGVEGFQARYTCTVFDWGTGWTGYVEVRPNSNAVYCPADLANFTDITADLTHDFGCISSNTVTIKGLISLNAKNSSISSIVITDLLTGFKGVCRFDSTAYRCVLPYDGDSVDVSVTVTASDHVCGASNGMFTYLGYSANGSPYVHNIVIASKSSQCPIPISTTNF